MEQAQGTQQEKIQRIGFVVCAFLIAIGILVFILRWNPVLGVALIIGGIYGMAAVPNFRRLAPRPTRASDIDAHESMQRVFGYREDQ